MKRVVVAVTVAAFVAVASPVAARQDSNREPRNPAGMDVSPLPSIAPNVTETRQFAPSLPRNTGEGRRVVYSNSLQWVWVVDKNENVIRSMPASGRRGVPAPGTYNVTSQQPWSFSLDFEGVNFRWMTRFALGPAGGNIGFHEIPRKDGKAIADLQPTRLVRGFRLCADGHRRREVHLSLGHPRHEGGGAALVQHR